MAGGGEGTSSHTDCVSKDLYEAIVAELGRARFDMGEMKDSLTRELDIYRNEVEFLRGQVEYLQSNLDLIQKGMMSRLGLLPAQEGSTPVTSPNPVQTRTLPWSQRQATLEANSRKEYWSKRVAEVEETDAKKKAEASKTG